MKKKAFTLIELLVVIAIIGVLATVSIIALSNARAKSRDAKRAGDMKQIQTALELFFNDKNRYPTAEEFALGSIFSTSTYGTSTYMQIIPNAPTPVDGSCSSGQNTFTYAQTDNGNSYTISFCLGNTTGTLDGGPKCLTPAGIVDMDCSSLTMFALYYGGAGDQSLASVDETSDGGYVAVGANYESDADGDVYLLKVDSNGLESWVQNIGGVGYQEAGFVQQTADGGYIIVGINDPTGSDADVYLVKTDSSGNVTWDQSIGGGAGSQDAFAGQQTADGGYIIAGSTDVNDNDVYLVKTDSGGNVTWDQEIGGAGYQSANSVQQTADGGYIIAGWSGVNNGDFYLVKTDSGGNVTWDQEIGGLDGETVSSVQQTADGGYILAGSTSANGVDIYLVKTDSSGNVIWDQSIGGTGNQSAFSVQETSDGGYIIAGRKIVSDSDIYLVKTDSSGNVTWTQTIADSGGQALYTIQQTSDGGYITAGYSDINDGDAYLIKTDQLGNSE